MKTQKEKVYQLRTARTGLPICTHPFGRLVKKAPFRKGGPEWLMNTYPPNPLKVRGINKPTA